MYAVHQVFYGLRHRALVRTAGHAHPARQAPQLVHHVEALRAAVHLQHHAGATLRGPHRARVQRQPGRKEHLEKAAFKV